MDGSRIKPVPENPGRVAADYGVGRHILCHNGTTADNRAIAHLHRLDKTYPGANPYIVADNQLLLIEWCPMQEHILHFEYMVKRIRRHLVQCMVLADFKNYIVGNHRILANKDVRLDTGIVMQVGRNDIGHTVEGCQHEVPAFLLHGYFFDCFIKFFT